MKRIILYFILILFAFSSSNANAKMDPSVKGENLKQDSGPSAPKNFYLWGLLEHRIMAPDFYK